MFFVLGPHFLCVFIPALVHVLHVLLMLGLHVLHVLLMLGPHLLHALLMLHFHGGVQLMPLLLCNRLKLLLTLAMDLRSARLVLVLDGLHRDRRGSMAAFAA